jgi:hypothetical protein
LELWLIGASNTRALIAGYILAPACCQFSAQYIEGVNLAPDKQKGSTIKKLN